MSKLVFLKTITAKYYATLLPKLVFRIYFRQLELDIRSSVSNYVPLLLFFKMHSLTQYNVLVDLIVYDNPGKIKRFTIIYLLSSVRFNTRVRVQTQTDEIHTVFTITNLFKNANWSEREVWDMFGIFFFGNRDLRRILTDYGFIGHPLRKDFPLTGFTEIFYSDFYKRIVHRPVELMQEYRNFNFVSPWSN